MTSDATSKSASSSAEDASNTFIRKCQYYSMLLTLLVDAYYSKGECLMHLTIWSWILHIFYFEVPLTTNTTTSNNTFLLRLFHGPSMGGSLALWNMYLWTMIMNPNMEFDLAPEGRKVWVVYVRAVWLHITPVIFHYIDYNNNIEILRRQVYNGTSSNTALVIWSAVGGYLAMGLTWEQLQPEGDGGAASVYNVTLVSPEVYVYVSKALGVASCLIMYYFYLKPLMT